MVIVKLHQVVSSYRLYHPLSAKVLLVVFGLLQLLLVLFQLRLTLQLLGVRNSLTKLQDFLPFACLIKGLTYCG